MSHEPGAPPAPAEADDLLLDAKFTVPQHRPTMVSRAAVVDAARRSGRKVVGITAPAGYGKTTLLAQWAALDERPVAWVSLDRLDDDPLRFLVVVATAFSRLPGGDRDLVTTMVGPDASLLGRVAPRLAAALRASPVPFLLVLDDLHLVRSPACHDLLEVVLTGIPDGSQLAAASRFEQPHLARLRSLGQSVEITAGDLALDAAGAEQVFAASHVPVSSEEAEVVARRTEGWPVGIYLASLVGRADGGRALALTGSDPYVADYLQRESFSRLAPSTKRFLRRTSVLETLSAPLCDAVLGTRSSGASLRELEASSLFLVPLDRRRQWFRYHDLFREFLLGELATEEPELVDTLRVRAADWYESNGSPTRAVEQLLETSERERCARLVARVVMSLFQTGQIATIDGWMRALGDAAIVAYPPLALMAGYVAAYEGRAADAERWGAVADGAAVEDEAVPVDGTASFASARAMFRALRCPDGPERMADDARFAEEQEPVWSVWRDTALTLGGDALLLLGDVEAATARLELAVSSAAEVGNGDTLAYSEAMLAHVDMDRGRWDRAHERVQHAVDTVEERRMDDYPTSAYAFAAAARLALHAGDRVAAQRLVTRAMRARTFCTYAFPSLAVRVRLQLARTSWALGDLAAVRHLLREAGDVLLRRPRLGTLVDEVQELHEKFDAGTPVRRGATSPLSPAELRLLPFLQTHLTIQEIGERLFVSRNTASTEIGSIYRKLGVTTRGAAVDRAAEMGLLGG